MPSLKYYGQRTLLSLISLLGAITFIFLLTHILPGNPLIARVGFVGEDTFDQIDRQLGLDQPLTVQFGNYMGGILQGDLGKSHVTGRPVLNDLQSRLPASLELAFYATILAFGAGLPLGILAAVKQDTLIDHAARIFSSIGISIPSFWLGLILIYFLYFQLDFAAAPLGRLSIRYTTPDKITGFLTVDTLLAGDIDAFRDSVLHLILPALTLAIVVMAPIVRITRTTVLENLRKDYVDTARAVGLKYQRIILQDVLQNSLVALITVAGLVFGFLVAGSLLVERVFSWPGVGLYAFNALVNNDFTAIQGFIILTTILYISLNWLVDILYAVIDPRIRI